MRSWSRQAVRFMAALALVLPGVAACKRPSMEKASVDTPAVAPTSTAEPSTVTAAAGAINEPPEMPFPASNAEELKKYARPLDYRPDWGEPRDDDDHCTGGGCLLRIAPVSGVVRLGLPQYAGNGRVVARVQNDGPGRNKTYNLRNGQVAYMHLRHDAGRTIATLYDTATGTIIRPRADSPLDKAGDGYVLNDCGHPSDGNTQSRAHFKGCANAHALRADTAAGRTHTSPAWISCAEGCCSLGP